jgi:hypothetical protein
MKYLFYSFYYYIYLVIKPLMMGLSNPHYRVSALVFTIIGLNIITVPMYLEFGLNNYLYVTFLILWVVINMFRITYYEKYKKILHQFEKENNIKKIIGVIISISYIFISLYTFLMI